MKLGKKIWALRRLIPAAAITDLILSARAAWILIHLMKITC